MQQFYTIIAIWFWWFLWAISRYSLTNLVNTTIPHNHLSYWTFASNVIWSLIIWILFWIFGLMSVNIYLKSFIVTGFLWALTTFSTFAMESFFLLDAWNFKYFLINVWLNLFFTIFFVFIGYYWFIYLIKLFGINY